MSMTFVLFEECLELKKLNSFALKKLQKLELENVSLENKCKESSSILKEFSVVKESSKVDVKTLTCDFEKSSAQLQSFTSSSKKIDNMLELNKLNTHAASSSETKLATAFVMSKCVLL